MLIHTQQTTTGNLSSAYAAHPTKRPKINPYSAGIDFGRQNLTSVDVRFWRLKSIPALWV